MARPMRRTDVEELAVSIRALLADPDADINEPLRRRWESGPGRLEVVIGENKSFGLRRHRVGCRSLKVKRRGLVGKP